MISEPIVRCLTLMQNRPNNGLGLGLVLGLITLLLHWYAPATMVEHLYGRGLFKFVRVFLDHTIGLIPIPVFYIVLIVLILVFGSLLRNVLKSFRQSLKSLLLTSVQLINMLGWLIFAFYWLWGFNYDRPSLSHSLAWSELTFSEAEFKAESERVLRSLTDLRNWNNDLIDTQQIDFDFGSIAQLLRSQCNEIAQTTGYLTSDRLVCRQLRPQGVLLRLSTAGFYNPLTGECNIDAGLHPLQKPFVMAHEFFHGLGVSGEGDCNFLAYLACHSSSNPFIRYSGELSYWRYLRRGFYLTDPEGYEEAVQSLPETVHQDFKSIRETLEKYPDLAPKVRDAIYTAYLKGNHIQDGLANYNRIVKMVMHWRKHPNELKLK